MLCKLIACVDAASPMNTVGVETNLISLRRVDALKADLGRADGKRVAVNDPWHT
jgi:hypothetical protein